MNILLINPPIRMRFDPYYHPFGLASIASVLRNAGHDVEILDLNTIRAEKSDLIDVLPKKRYNIIGISGLISTYKYMTFLVPIVRGVYPDVPLVLGGGGFTSAYETYMENFKPDYGVIGEGEYTFLELVNGKPKEEILGLTYYENGKLVVNPPRPLEPDLDNFPPLAFDLLDMETYAETIRHNKNAKREIGILATRGCPMDCAFCYHIFGRGVRYRSVDRVLEEMEFLINSYQIESFLFGDECMTAKRSWIREFCEKLINKNWDVEWSCFSRVDTIDEETMQLMVKAGCFFVGFGLESGSQRILDDMNKKVTIAKMKDTWRKAKKYFPIVTGTMIFGMPNENEETIRETIEFCVDIEYTKSFLYLQPYPGTKVFNDNRDKIIELCGSLHNFFCKLDDAGIFTINLTKWNDDFFVFNKFEMEREINLRVYFRRTYLIVETLLKDPIEVPMTDEDITTQFLRAAETCIALNKTVLLLGENERYYARPDDIRILVESTKR